MPGGWTTADLPAGAPLGVAVALMLGFWKGDRRAEGRRRVRGARTRGCRLRPRARQVTPRRVTAPGARPAGPLKAGGAFTGQLLRRTDRTVDGVGASSSLGRGSSACHGALACNATVLFGEGGKMKKCCRVQREKRRGLGFNVF